jgi:hypothetical protein
MTMTELVPLSERITYSKALAASDLLPKQFRGRPENVLVALEYGAALGLAPMAAIQGIHVVEGKPTASAQLIGALVRMAGHRLRVTGNDTEAHAQVIRSDDPDFAFESVWTLDRAARAGLTGKGVWKSYPAAMLKARAITEVARDACPEVLAGVAYTAEELEPASAAAPSRHAPPAVPQSPPTTVTVATASGSEPVDTETGEIVDADVIEDQAQPDDATADYLHDHATIPKDRHLVATAAQLKKIHAACRNLGYTERDDVLRLISLTLGEPIGSSKDLTKDTASTVIDALEALEATDDPQAAIDALAGAA